MTISREELNRTIQVYAALGQAAGAEELGISRSALKERIRRARRAGIDVPYIPERNGANQHDPTVDFRSLDHHPHHISAEIKNGTILVGSDAHIWPEHLEPWTTAMGAFLKMAELLQPDMIVLNGDIIDGADLSRFPSIGWEKKPAIAQEIEAVQEFLGELTSAAPNAWRVWTLGNHDLRFETRIATVAPEFRGVDGIHLKDHFPEWAPCWGIWINEGRGQRPVVIKHRFRGGINAAYMNTLYAGMTIATGHLHRLIKRPFADYWGTRYGVETGMLARRDGPQFLNYTEGNPLDWQPGFVVFTFKDGKAVPELVEVKDEDAGTFEFRGEILEV